MVFLSLHQKNELILILRDIIAVVMKPLKGSGSLIVTSDGETSYLVDETVAEIQELMLDSDLEAEIVAND